MSLKLGATNLREEIARRRSCSTNAFSSNNGVKNLPTDGTKKRNFERSGVPSASQQTFFPLAKKGKNQFRA
jgi:hypothetical protein